MTGLQFRDLIHEVEPEPGEAAKMFGTTPAQVTAWAEGTEPVPALVARTLDWQFKALYREPKPKSIG